MKRSRQIDGHFSLINICYVCVRIYASFLEGTFIRKEDNGFRINDTKPEGEFKDAEEDSGYVFFVFLKALFTQLAVDYVLLGISKFISESSLYIYCLHTTLKYELLSTEWGWLISSHLLNW